MAIWRVEPISGCPGIALADYVYNDKGVRVPLNVPAVVNIISKEILKADASGFYAFSWAGHKVAIHFQELIKRRSGKFFDIDLDIKKEEKDFPSVNLKEKNGKYTLAESIQKCRTFAAMEEIIEKNRELMPDGIDEIKKLSDKKDAILAVLL